MSNEFITQLPPVTNAQLSDIIMAVQGYNPPATIGISSQETLQQVFNLMLANTILHFAGNPTGLLAGVIYQLCYDTVNNKIYVCTTSGPASTAVWTLASAGAGLVTPAQGGTGIVNPTAHTLPVAEGASAFNFLGPLTDGQFLIGRTGLDPIPATITGGTNIVVTPGSGTLTVSTTGPSSFGWILVSGTSDSMIPNIGYITTNFALTTLSLPVLSNVGDELSIVSTGFGGFTITQGSGQNIQIGALSSTPGVTGSVSSTNQFDSVNLVCTVQDLTWQNVGAPQGNLAIV